MFHICTDSNSTPNSRSSYHSFSFILSFSQINFVFFVFINIFIPPFSECCWIKYFFNICNVITVSTIGSICCIVIVSESQLVPLYKSSVNWSRRASSSVCDSQTIYSACSLLVSAVNPTVQFETMSHISLSLYNCPGTSVVILANRRYSATAQDSLVRFGVLDGFVFL